MPYVIAYFVGGVAAILTANVLWYPAPNLHGVQLGLLMGAIFAGGAGVAMIFVAAARRS